MSRFSVGQKIVAVADHTHDSTHILVKGEVYTVRSLKREGNNVILEEFGDQFWPYTRRFAPLIEGPLPKDKYDLLKERHLELSTKYDELSIRLNFDKTIDIDNEWCLSDTITKYMDVMGFTKEQAGHVLGFTGEEIGWIIAEEYGLRPCEVEAINTVVRATVEVRRRFWEKEDV